MRYITDQSLELPVSLKTVSEFRQTRSCGKDSASGASSALETTGCCDEITTATIYAHADNSVSVPASFTAAQPDNAASSNAISEFMSKGVDFQTAFEYAAPAASANTSPSLKTYSSENATGLDSATDTPIACEKDIATIASEHDAYMAPRHTGNDTVTDLSKNAVQTFLRNGSPVETDPAGRVVRSFFCDAEVVSFTYNIVGELIEFNYANMNWTKTDDGWAAKDRQTEYSLDGKITVLADGSIRIERSDVVRILKTSGTRIDEHKSGSRTESRKMKNKPSAYDLLAKAKAVNSLWLNGRSSFKGNCSNEQSFPAPLKLDLVNDSCQAEEEPNAAKSLIPKVAKVQAPAPAVVKESNLSCVPTAPIELRSLERTRELRCLEESLLETSAAERLSLKLQVTECLLKSHLWLTDRIAGQSSPKHLAQLDRLAGIYQSRQRNDLAELTHQRALHIREQFYGKGQPELAVSVRGLAGVQLSRSNFQRAEELYKEAIELYENGLRKILFLYSEKVTDAAKLGAQLNELFGTVGDLSRLYALQGRQQLCSVVYEKALALSSEIIEREPAAEETLNEAVKQHLNAMQELCLN